MRWIALLLVAFSLRLGVTAVRGFEREPVKDEWSYSEIAANVTAGEGFAFDVTRKILGQGLQAVGAGTLLGLAASFLLTDFLSDLLWGIGATDLPTYVVCSGSVVLAGLGATYLTARRAMGIDPVEALKRE